MEWKRGYLDDLRYQYDRHGNKFKKYDPTRRVTHRCSDGLDNMIKEYAKESPITKSFCGEGDFQKVLKEAKSKR